LSEERVNIELVKGNYICKYGLVTSGTGSWPWEVDLCLSLLLYLISQSYNFENVSFLIKLGNVQANLE